MESWLNYTQLKMIRNAGVDLKGPVSREGVQLPDNKLWKVVPIKAQKHKPIYFNLIK